MKVSVLERCPSYGMSVLRGFTVIRCIYVECVNRFSLFFYTNQLITTQNLIHFIDEKCIKKNKDFKSGADINRCGDISETYKDCQKLCQKREGCVKFTYIEPTYNGIYGHGFRKKCCLKSGSSLATKNLPDVTSGRKYCPGKCWCTLIK